MNEWEWNLLEDKAAVDYLQIDGRTVRVGDRVRLCPQAGGDILDIALRGQFAIIESIEEDYEGSKHICVVLDDDPGRDLGMMRQPGHRFFFTASELEPVAQASPISGAESVHRKSVNPRILVAGVGNIFLGDDAFGVEVVRRLMNRDLPAAVRVIDFGIRGIDLAYALQDGYQTTILVDAFPHGKTPGTVSVVEPDTNDITSGEASLVEAHTMHPLNVLRMVRAMNGSLNRILLVGCEPASLGGEEGCMGLSEPVEAAVEEAVNATEALITRLMNEQTL